LQHTSYYKAESALRGLYSFTLIQVVMYRVILRAEHKGLHVAEFGQYSEKQGRILDDRLSYEEAINLAFSYMFGELNAILVGDDQVAARSCQLLVDPADTYQLPITVTNN
jgi:hypothetical protein